MIPNGKCDKCGQIWYGWALKDPKNQTCDCGGTIVLKQEVAA